MTVAIRTLLIGVCCLFVLLARAADVAPAAPPAEPPVEKAVLPDDARLMSLVVNSFWRTNCFIIASKAGEAIIIDPGDEVERLAVTDDRYRATGDDAKRIFAAVEQYKLKVKYIVLTHGHIDHIGALRFLKEKTGAEILMHAGDVREGCAKDTHMFEGGLPKVDRTLKDGELLTLDGMSLQVIHTPGHSPGGISLLSTYKNKTILFSGDTLLYHTVGRTNFRDGSGDEALLMRSIREKLFTLPDDTIVLTGHYDFTTIGEEKANNPFILPAPAVPAAAP